LFKHHSCAVVYWDKDKNVFGTGISSSKDGKIKVLQTACSDSRIPDFPGRLLDVCNRLEPGENQRIILASRFEGAICIELNFPKLNHSEMQKALDFELPRHIPVPMEEVIWNYRVLEEIPGEDRNQLHSKVRILAVNRKSWDSVLSDIVASGVKADTVIHPLMVFSHLPEDPESMLDNPDELLKLLAVETASGSDMSSKFTGLEKLEGLSSNQRTGLLICLIIGEYVLQGISSPESLSLSRLPDILSPQRFRAIRYSAAVLFMVVLMLGTVLLARNWLDARARYGRITKEKQRISSKIDEFKQERLRNKKIDELIKKIGETNPGNSEVLQCLQILSQKLPSNMWISMFSSRDDEIDVTICTMKDQTAQADLSKLNGIPLFSSFSIRSTRRDSDGTLTIFVHIVYQGKFKRRKANG